MKKLLALGIVAILVLSIAAVAFAAEPKSFDEKAAVGTKATDAVSGEVFTIGEKSPNSEYESKYFYFENEANKTMFDADPANFAN